MSSNQSSTQNNNSSTQGNNNTQADASASTEPPMTDRILMRNDSILIIQNGEATGLDKEYKLQSGAVVSTKGMVKYPSGKTVQLKNGQFIELTPAADDDSKATEDKTTKSKSKKSSKTKKSTTSKSPTEQ